MHVDFLFKIILQIVHVIVSRFQKYSRNFPIFNLMKSICRFYSCLRKQAYRTSLRVY